jgi:hypothetical protein
LAAKRTARSIRTGVFFIALLRIADQADQAIANVVNAVGVIEHPLGDRIVIQGVDGEVATLGVFFQRAINVVPQNPPALVTRRLVAVFVFVILRMIGAEGRHLDDFTTEMDVNQLETATDDAGVAEFCADLLRRGAGGDVEVFRRDAQHQVTYATADQIGLVTRILQALDDAHRIAAELIALQRMLAVAEHFRRCTHVLLRLAQRRTE